jgi:hypothetical protein
MLLEVVAPGTRTSAWSEIAAWQVVTACNNACAAAPGFNTMVRTVPGLGTAGWPRFLPLYRNCTAGYPRIEHFAEDEFWKMMPAVSTPCVAPPRTPVRVSCAAVHGGGPVGGGVVLAVGELLAVTDGVVDADVVAGADDGAGVDTGAADDEGALADVLEGTDGELTTDDVPPPPPDDVQATALRATMAIVAANRARLNCRSADRSSTAGSSA